MNRFTYFWTRKNKNGMPLWLNVLWQPWPIYFVVYLSILKLFDVTSLGWYWVFFPLLFSYTVICGFMIISLSLHIREVNRMIARAHQLKNRLNALKDRANSSTDK